MHDLTKAQPEQLPAWLTSMRAAVMQSISTSDVTAIVKQQVEAAKRGDAKAIRFVFEHVLSAGMKGATFVQNNFGSDALPSLPTKARPGTNGKLVAMRQRAAAGLPLTRDDDGPTSVDLD